MYDFLSLRVYIQVISGVQWQNPVRNFKQESVQIHNLPKASCGVTVAACAYPETFLDNE